MNRRLFIFSSFGVASFLSLGALRAFAGKSLFDKVSGEMFTDNDEFPLEDGGRPDMNPRSDLYEIAYGLKYYPYETVVTYISPTLEEQFDLFFFANTATQSSKADLIPHQNMKAIKRIKPGPLFIRNEKGVITGLTENAEIYRDHEGKEFFAISSGRGGNKILTYSGIFRFHHSESKRRIGTNESFNANMSFSMYIDFLYNTGVEARVAIHGTPPRNYRLLGNSRASEGCLRVRPENARQIRNLLLSPEMWSETLPEFDRRAQLPSPELQAGQVKTRAGIKALAIFFDGYQNPGTDV